LDHDGSTLLVDVAMSGLRIGEGLVACRGNVVAYQELLGEVLGAFQLSCSARRAEYLQSARTEHVDHARGQGGFRPDDREGYIFLTGKVGQFGVVGDGDVPELAITGGTAVARGNEYRF